MNFYKFKRRENHVTDQKKCDRKEKFWAWILLNKPNFLK